MRAYGVGLLSAFPLLFPTTIQAQSEKHPKSIVIMSALPKVAAYERATAALVDAGYAISDANPVAITSERRTFKNVWDLQVRANVLSVGDSSRVIMTGSYWVTCCGMLKLDNRPVEGGRSGVAGKMWDELEVAADSVRRAVSTAERTARE